MFIIAIGSIATAIGTYAYFFRKMRDTLLSLTKVIDQIGAITVRVNDLLRKLLLRELACNNAHLKYARILTLITAVHTKLSDQDLKLVNINVALNVLIDRDKKVNLI